MESQIAQLSHHSISPSPSPSGTAEKPTTTTRSHLSDPSPKIASILQTQEATTFESYSRKSESVLGSHTKPSVVVKKVSNTKQPPSSSSSATTYNKTMNPKLTETPMPLSTVKSLAQQRSTSITGSIRRTASNRKSGFKIKSKFPTTTITTTNHSRTNPQKSANYRSRDYDSTSQRPEVSERRLRLNRIISQYQQEVQADPSQLGVDPPADAPTEQAPYLMMMTRRDNDTIEEDKEKELNDLATAFQRLLSHGKLESHVKTTSDSNNNIVPTYTQQQQGMFV